jgi:hypothetical protein
VGIAHPAQFLINLKGSLKMLIDVNNIEKQITTTFEDIAKNNNFRAIVGSAKSTLHPDRGTRNGLRTKISFQLSIFLHGNKR